MNRPPRTSPSSHREREREYLERQAAEASDAIRASLQDMRQQAAALLDLRLWARQFPIMTSATAMLLGFAAASVLVPQRSAPRSARSCRRMAPWLRRLRHSALVFLRSVMLSSLGAVLRGRSPAAAPGSVGNGSHAPIAEHA